MTKYSSFVVSAFLLVAGLGPFSQAVRASADAPELAETYAGKMKDMQLAFQNTLEQQQKINADLLSRLDAHDTILGQVADSSALRRKTIDLAGEEKHQRVLKSSKAGATVADTGTTKMGKKSDGKGSSSSSSEDDMESDLKICFGDNLVFGQDFTFDADVTRRLDDVSTETATDNDQVVADLGVIDVEEGESILLQITLSSAIVSSNVIESDDDHADAFIAASLGQVVVTPSLFRCTDDTCLTVAGGLIPAEPASSITVQATYDLYAEGDDDGFVSIEEDLDNGNRRLDDYTREFQDGQISTNTVTIFYPASSLGEGSYDLVLSADTTGVSFTGVSGFNSVDAESNVSVSLGPYVIQVETIKAEETVCPFTQVTR